jgi:hypothetical protein
MATLRALALAFLLAALAAAPAARTLSSPLCEGGGLVWVTERPGRSDPDLPHASLWFFCPAGINVNGQPVDACTFSGAECDPLRTATLLCRTLGFDEAAPDEVQVAAAPRGVPVLSLTGEACLRRGQYLPSGGQPPADLAALPGEPCAALSGVACIRRVPTMAGSLAAGIVAAAAEAPAAEVRVLESAPGAPPALGRKLL